jgi:hypothetical protein
MKNMKYRASVALIWWLAPIGSSQPLATAQGPLVDARPLAEASLRLQENSGRIVTYEEPVLTWSGDLEEIPGRSGSKGYLYPKMQAFWMPEPASAPDLAAALNKVLDNYHQQTSGTRFQILTSPWGYHIVPRQVHDANGALVASASLLDSRITIAQNQRTPEGHLAALATAVAAVTGTRLEVSAIPGKPHGFDEAFRARPERFSWGAEPTTARDVLIDLLSRIGNEFLVAPPVPS